MSRRKRGSLPADTASIPLTATGCRSMWPILCSWNMAPGQSWQYPPMTSGISNLPANMTFPSSRWSIPDGTTLSGETMDGGLHRAPVCLQTQEPFSTMASSEAGQAIIEQADGTGFWPGSPYHLPAARLGDFPAALLGGPDPHDLL